MGTPIEETRVDSVLLGGDRFVDGAYFAPERARTRRYASQAAPGVLAPANLPLLAGYVEFWFKPDRVPAPGSIELFWGHNPIGAGLGVETRLEYQGSGFLLRRLFFTPAGTPIGLPIPLPGGLELPTDVSVGEVETFAPLALHRWTHVEFWWQDLMQIHMRIDGDSDPERRSLGLVALDPALAPREADFGVGCDPFRLVLEGAGRVPGGTFAHLAVVELPGLALLDGAFLADRPTERYAAGEDPYDPLACYDLTLPLADDEELAGIAWTEREPEGTAIDLLQEDAEGRTLLLPRDGAGARASSSSLRIAFTRVPLAPILATPILDDLTLVALIPTEFLAWSARVLR